MIVDTSIIVAILRAEPEARSYIQILLRNPGAQMSAGSWIELGPVLAGLAEARLEEQLVPVFQKLRMMITPVTAEQADIGRRAYAKFGKGHHPARLNFGDCFSYALAKATGEPLLFKGDDFAQTDIIPA